MDIWADMDYIVQVKGTTKGANEMTTQKPTIREKRTAAIERDHVAAFAMIRLPHCTNSWGDHSWACDRNGKYCQLSSDHKGACQPHGTAK